jgi:hypothetical protein
MPSLYLYTIEVASKATIATRVVVAEVAKVIIVIVEVAMINYKLNLYSIL